MFVSDESDPYVVITTANPVGLGENTCGEWRCQQIFVRWVALPLTDRTLAIGVVLLGEVKPFLVLPVSYREINMQCINEMKRATHSRKLRFEE